MAKIAVSIIPAEDTPFDHAEKLRAWRKDDLVSLELQTFADILKEVRIPLSSSGDGPKQPLWSALTGIIP